MIWGKKIYLPSLAEGISVIDLDGSEMTTFQPGFSVTQVGVNAQGGLLVATGIEGEMAILNLRGDILWKEKSEHSWASCEMNKNGDRIVAVSNKGEVECYSVTTGAKVYDSPKMPDTPPPIPGEETIAPVEDKPVRQRKKSTPRQSDSKDHFDFLEVE